MAFRPAARQATPSPQAVDQKIKQAVREFFPAWGNEASLSLFYEDESVRQAVNNYDTPALIDAIRALIKSGRIPLRNEVNAALDQAWRQNPDYARNHAYDRELLEAATDAGFAFDNVGAWDALIQTLSQQGRFKKTPQAQARDWDTDFRQQLIQNITLGRSQYTAFSKTHGKPMNFDSSELESFSTQQLREIDEAVAGYRRIRDGVKAPIVVEETNEGIASRVSAGRGVEYMGGQQDPDGQGDVLIDPRTGAEYVSIANIKNDIRNLLFTPTKQSRGPKRLAAVNELLARLEAARKR